LSVKIGNLIGIPIVLHYTWFLALVFISWTLSIGYLPTQYPNLSTKSYWIIGIISTLLLLISVLLHELSHSYVAKKLNLSTSRIVLFIFGGVSQITEEPKDPSVEFKVSIVGPVTSYILALIFGILWYGLKQLNYSQLVLAPIHYGMLINALLGSFNLIPAFPLDGGRMLRAGLWKRTNDLVKATNIASKIGVAFAYFLMFIGIVSVIIEGYIGGIWLIFIGWFVKNGSESSMKQTIIGEALAGFKVSDIMTKKVHTISENTTANEIIENFFKHKHGGFPVVEKGELTGCVTIQDVKKVPKEKWTVTKASHIMTKRKDLVLTTPKEPIVDAMTKMSKHNIGRLPVVHKGELVGIISRSDVMHIIRAKTELK
jgi:Zn-dependent protease/CBS domain-containing protein